MKGDISYYKILGVNENASNYELRKAFCKLSIELHPDTTSLELEDAKNKFQKVLEAYENLNNSNLCIFCYSIFQYIILMENILVFEIH